MFRKYSKVSKVESCLLRHTNSHMYQPYRHIKFVFGLLFCILKRSRDFLYVHPVNINFLKNKCVQGIIEAQSILRLRIEIKTSLAVFYRRIKYPYSFECV